MGPHKGQEELKSRVRRLQRRLREQEHEIRAVTAKNQAGSVKSATLDLRVAVQEDKIRNQQAGDNVRERHFG